MRYRNTATNGTGSISCCSFQPIFLYSLRGSFFISLTCRYGSRIFGSLIHSQLWKSWMAFKWVFFATLDWIPSTTNCSSAQSEWARSTIDWKRKIIKRRVNYPLLLLMKIIILIIERWYCAVQIDSEMLCYAQIHQHIEMSVWVLNCECVLRCFIGVNPEAKITINRTG